MRRVKSESWLGRIGLGRGGGWRKAEPEKSAVVGVLAFEIGRLMSRITQLWHALGDDRVDTLREEVRLEGVRKLVSDDDDFLFALAHAETMDAVGFLAGAVAHLGRRCSDPALQRFDAAFADLVKTGADPCGLEYDPRKMDHKVKKMERFVAAGADLYEELEVLDEMEQAMRRMPENTEVGHPSHVIVAEFKHKVAWQRQHVKCLREVSLWVRSYDYVVRLLGRSLFSIIGRVRRVFGIQVNSEAVKRSGENQKPAGYLSRSHSTAGLMSPLVDSSDVDSTRMFASGPLVVAGHESKSGRCVKGRSGLLPPPPARKQQSSRIRRPARGGGPFSGCIFGGNESVVVQSRIPLENGIRKSSVTPLAALDAAGEASSEANIKSNAVSMVPSFAGADPRSRLLKSPAASTLGGAALSFHYANVILVIEKLASSPHLIDSDARDDLYSLLTASIKRALRARLKSYAKNLGSSVSDPVLAAEWSAAVTRILEWLAPLAHNTIRWQTERSFEQQSVVASSNILLLQTLHYANQRKAEDAITELLVGLNYLWRCGRELHAKAMLECASSRNLDDGALAQFKFEACPTMR